MPLGRGRTMKPNLIRNTKGKFVSVPANPNETHRTCWTCKQAKHLSLFGNHKTGILGKKGRCKQCDSDASSRYNKQNPEKRYAHGRRSNLRRFGLTPEAYAALFHAQGGACAMCGALKAGGRGAFPVDHCHSTGVVRGIICNNCNLLLGHANDDISLLQNAISYLLKTGTR